MVLAPPLNPDIVRQLTEKGLLREGHFAYRSGQHTSVMVNRDRLLTDPHSASRMGYALAKSFFTSKIDTVATPSVWGAGLAQWVAWFLEPRAQVIFATPSSDDTMEIAANFHELVTGKRVLLVDNLIFTGETMSRFEALITALGGQVVGIGCLWSSATQEFNDREVVGLLNQSFPSWVESSCPLCRGQEVELESLPW
jgi:orotate phosphoribosyltransferase